MRGWLTAPASARIGKVDGFTIRATAIAVVAAVLSVEQLPFSSR